MNINKAADGCKAPNEYNSHHCQTFFQLAFRMKTSLSGTHKGYLFNYPSRILVSSQVSVDYGTVKKLCPWPCAECAGAREPWVQIPALPLTSCDFEQVDCKKQRIVLGLRHF